MKTSLAVIRLYLKVGKKYADGTHPIMLMVSFNGRKEVSTGYTCTEKYWDKRNQCVKKGYPNFVAINQYITRLKNEAISKRDKYIASNELYTPSMILAKDDVKNAVTNDFCGLIERYIAEKGLENKTIEKWRIIKRNVIQYCGKRDILVNEIDEAFCRRYCRWLENERKLSDGSIRSYMAKVVCILHYAVSLGLIDKYPLDGWKYHKDYRDSKSELYIHARSMEVMMDMFLDEMIEGDRNVAGDNIPLIDLSCRYYSYRHSYIMSQIQSDRVNLLKLATEVGKSVQTIHQYVTLLNDEDLI